MANYQVLEKDKVCVAINLSDESAAEEMECLAAQGFVFDDRTIVANSSEDAVFYYEKRRDNRSKKPLSEDEYFVDVSYDQIPFYRKRWFWVLSFLLFTPLSFIILITGECYLENDNQVYKLPRKQRTSLAFTSFVFMIVSFNSVLGY
ncbi:hypothetical protein A3K86_21025 [Photobacterium jeanii]|uniref:Uncharacterized protein n=1 Tax=Photobacterium jeanii TaxID=858640 RepID=A0A178K285_9GAMM|nr:hypothetical protein [Photobacterium jeanii]OAN11428.1 hypothetical protein A3K86_21025 [Photobacterium jeanii]PST90948.1 hypothetical protein C9I91_10130 [Photobacterium jeanii]